MKALKMPQEKTKDETSIKNAQEEIERLKFQLKLLEEEQTVKTNKLKWWHFGKM